MLDTVPVFDEEGRLIGGNILGNMFPRDIKDFVCNLQNDENKNEEIRETTIDSYSFSTFGSESPRWGCLANKTKELLPLVDEENVQYHVEKAWLIAYPLYHFRMFCLSNTNE